MNYRLTELKVLLFLLLLSAVSCQRPMYDEEDDEDGVSQTNLPLKISARSSEESPINYPAYIYAFAEDGSCSASLKMTDTAQIEMKLSLIHISDCMVLATRKPMLITSCLLYTSN